MPDSTTEQPDTFNWQAVISDAYRDLAQYTVDHLPQIFGAVLLLILGWVTAFLAKLLTRKVVHGLNTLFAKAARYDGAKRERIKNFYTQILSSIVFWIVLLFFISAAANLLGWQLFSNWMESLVGFLPSLVSGLLIILAGYLIGNAARSAIARAQIGSNTRRAETLSRIAQAVILVSGIVIGVEQIGLNVSFLTNVFVVVIGILLAGAAAAFSLGAKDMMANVIGSLQAKRHCRVGERIAINGIEGDILEITQTIIVVDSTNGKMLIPAKLFQEQATQIGTLEEKETP